MNARIERLKHWIRTREYRTDSFENLCDFTKEMDADNLSWVRRVARLTTRMCEAQDIIINPDENIVFIQTTPVCSTVYNEDEWFKLIENKTLHEGVTSISNICPNWELLLSQGLEGRKRQAYSSRERLMNDLNEVDFLDACIETIDAILNLASRYRSKAEESGRYDLVEVLSNIPANPPKSFHEALQFLRLVLAVTWLIGHYQIGLGRFDQYMLPYLQNDFDNGRIDLSQAEELLADFFLSLNKDNDIYPGVQPGDNGQTIVLGGINPDGSSAVNELTEMVLKVSYELGMIDPKINLRITKVTAPDLLFKAMKLTSKGLGFPQYLNDDVIIPALISHGYSIEDAYNYSVAGCWEPIIPGKGMEVVNTGAVSFPFAADTAIRAGLANGESYEWMLEKTKQNINNQARIILDAYSKILLGPSPCLSIMMEGCLEEGKDLSEGLVYNGFGIWGACAVSAAEALAATKHFIFDKKQVEPADLISALEADFEGYTSLRQLILDEAPRIGNNHDIVDSLMVELFDYFAEACETFGRNHRGGIIRPGVSTAMYYMWLAQGHHDMREPVVGPTADGRRKGEPFSANLAPSPNAYVAGPFSVLHSFSKIDFQRLFNGGPVTLEFSESVFRDEEAIEKVALFIRAFIQSGCQQLQLNTLNRAKLLEAKTHPWMYRDLIVRVWGWSGYFCELAAEYQDQIIARHVFGESQN
jgi:pyruvate-formate lyase